LGIAHIRVLVDQEEITTVSNQLTWVVGTKPDMVAATAAVWVLDTPTIASAGQNGHESPQLILTTPKQDDEYEALKEKGPGVYEIAFWVDKDRDGGCVDTPYGKIIWRPK
jgi:hypothetical protein